MQLLLRPRLRSVFRSFETRTTMVDRCDNPRRTFTSEALPMKRQISAVHFEGTRIMLRREVSGKERSNEVEGGEAKRRRKISPLGFRGSLSWRRGRGERELYTGKGNLFVEETYRTYIIFFL
uniref:Uncharacterized protein n=1 Tax=Ananas comosus var. bracteatus TaxID=296719 RepID=A0A6V7Q001_ANACO|nr:unnamed protein product [Ananas comosus var. bracteatus]